MAMSPEFTIELCDAIGMCSGGLVMILKEYYKIPWNERDNTILENFGFILAYLCVKRGISVSEAGECIACFIGVNLGKDTDKFEMTTNSFRFYTKHLQSMEDGSKDNFYTSSIIIYNLTRPKTWDGFENKLPLHQSFVDIIQLWMQVQSYLHEEIPKQINPILKRL